MYIKLSTSYSLDTKYSSNALNVCNSQSPLFCWLNRKPVHRVRVFLIVRHVHVLNGGKQYANDFLFIAIVTKNQEV